MVLAGIGKLVIVDGEEVAEEDLGAGFFYRDEDVGRKVSLFIGSLLFPLFPFAFFVQVRLVRGIDGSFSDMCILRSLSVSSPRPLSHHT